MTFQCHYCPKKFTRRYNLNGHIRVCHPGQLQNVLSSGSMTNEPCLLGVEKSSVPTKVSPCLEPLEPLETSLAKVDWYLKKLCPTKNESGGVTEAGGFTGSMPYIEPPARHVEKLWTEKNGDVEGSAKKKQRRRNWVIS